MPTKLPDFIVNRLFLILYFVCAKKLGLKIFLSHDSKCATSDIIVHREIHIHKNGCFYSFSVNIILQPRSFRIWFKSFWTQRYDYNICKLVTNNRRFWPGLGLPRPKAIVVIPQNQPLPKHLRKKTSKSAKHACHYATKERPVKITMYLGLDIIIKIKFTTIFDRCAILNVLNYLTKNFESWWAYS